MQKTVVNQIKVGSLIEILETDNVAKRFPQLIGDRGTVEATPIHPGIWFTIAVKSTGASIKIQQNAIKLIQPPVAVKENGLKTPLRQQKSNVAAEVVEDDDESKTANRPRSNSSPGSSHHSIAFALKCGMKVAIIGTENVVQRVPQLVDQIGVIKEAPVHPATWFKVEFPDHKIITFRPSALRPVDDDGNPIVVSFQQRLTSPVVASKSPPIKTERKPSIDRTISSAATKADIASAAPPPAKGNFSRMKKKASLTLLSATDPDGWVGRRVQIMGGRHNELQGTVRSSGNGWVQIDTEQGEVAKRAYELEILTSKSGSSSSSVISGGLEATEEVEDGDGTSDGVESANNPRLVNRNKKFKPVRVAPVRQNRTAAEGSSSYITSAKGISEEAILSTRTRNAATSSNNVSAAPKTVFIDQSNSRNTFTTTSESGSGSSGRSQRARAYSDPLTQSPTAGGARNNRGGGGFLFHNMMSTSNNSNQRGTSNDVFGHSSHSRSFDKPLKNSFLIDSKRNFIVKYVTKHQAKIGLRPDLIDWKYRIDATLHESCFEFEMQAARLFEETHCEVCNLEKWPSAKYCWSENCPISPVYYKLTGAAAPSKRSDGSATAVTLDNTHSSNGGDDCVLTAQPSSKRRRVDEIASLNDTTMSSDVACSSVLQCFGVGPAENSVTSYLLEVPARLLGDAHVTTDGNGVVAESSQFGRHYEYHSSSAKELSDFKPRSDSYASTDCEASHGSSPVSLAGGADQMGCAH